MHYLTGKEAEDAEMHCNIAAEIATKSKCQKTRHGFVLVKGERVIGRGWNAPHSNEVCDPCLRKDLHNHYRLDRCNSIHAERNAVDDAESQGVDVAGAIGYHARIKNGNVVTDNVPSCMSCAELLHEKGLEGVVLIHDQGYMFYPIDKFRELSFAYHGQ